MGVSVTWVFDKVAEKLCGMNSRIGHGCSCTPALRVRKNARRDSGWSSVAVGVASAVVSVSVSVAFFDADFGAPIGPKLFVGCGGAASLSGNMSKILDGAALRGGISGVEVAPVGMVAISLFVALDVTVWKVGAVVAKSSFLGL